MIFAPATEADQHLTTPAATHAPIDGPRETLCGRRFDALPLQVGVYDHRDGFMRTRPTACAECADAADAIQNGMG